MADLIGDWREEVILPSPDGRSLRLYATAIPTRHRIRCLMHDPQYRLGIAWQNVGYNKPPHPSFFLGDGMPTPPVPNIRPIVHEDEAARE
jgi:rhamnogalacturonan endolyase